MSQSNPERPVPGFEAQGLAQEPSPEPVFSPVLPPLDLDGLSKQTIDLAQVDWKPVSPKYVQLRLTRVITWSLAWFLLSFAPLVLTLLEIERFEPWAYWGLPVLVAIWRVFTFFLLKGRFRVLGYSERADHLLRRSGLFFRSVKIIPYGRIQYVDVSSGPIENLLSLASVRVMTPASGTKIPGLDRAEADRLREVLTELSDAKRVGL